MVCRDIGNDSFLVGNTSVKCDEYQDEKYGFLLPLLIVWVLIIPFFILLGLKNTQKIAKKQQKVNDFEEIDDDEISENSKNRQKSDE